MIHKKILVFVLIINFIFAGTISAAAFDPDYLISDSEMRDYSSLDLMSIQKFLDNKPGTLKSYIAIDNDGLFKTAAQTFFEVANKWRINPKFLLVLVQKEMGLLTSANPRQSQYDRATGYGCPDSGGCDDRWKGFYKQVNSAAAQTSWDIMGKDKNSNLECLPTADNPNCVPNNSTYQPGKTYTISGQQVTMKNLATAALYKYTPHVGNGANIGGNKLFWDLWNTYWSKKWPDGSLLKLAETDTFYYISNEEKREITSNAILLSRFDPDSAITVNAEDLGYYNDGVPIKYINFALLRPVGTTDIYMIVDDQKRKFENNELFTKTGFQEDEIIEVSMADLNVYKNGPNITKYTLYPAGALLQDSSTDDLYYILSSRKMPVVNQEILDYNFHGLPVTKVSPNELNRYLTGNPLTLPEGILVKNKTVNTVYVISNGKRLPIFSGEIFVKMNYKWENVKIVSDETLEVHPIGQTITGDWL